VGDGEVDGFGGAEACAHHHHRPVADHLLAEGAQVLAFVWAMGPPGERHKERPR
jgi:hypothetical protein